MKVLLAGYNVDSDVIAELVKNSPERDDVSPETLSAAYARISRDPTPVSTLRALSRKEVEKARQSNKAIIFKMGHHSVAEHAVFNFDIIGISRLAIEEIEHFRLCSYTEKSQRYITLGDDFVLPDELADSKYKDLFVETIGIQNSLYHKLYDRLKEHIFRKYQEKSDARQLNILDGQAKEDARYITSLATQGQLGETINARNLELLLRRFASSNLAEVRELGKKLYGLVEKVAPSIILFYKANDYDEKTYRELEKVIESKKWQEKKIEENDVELVHYPQDADAVILSSILHTVSKMPYRQCLEILKKMNIEEKEELVKTAFRHMEFYDAVLREFEYANLTYSMVISASCFAQLKRHRMATLTYQKYNPLLGVEIPGNICEIGMENEFMEVIKKTEDAYYKIAGDFPFCSSYILTNAHKRRVLFSCNARELYHISRLREDEHAQWDIRDKSSKMSLLAKKVMPLTMSLVGGKDSYPKVYESVFGKPYEWAGSKPAHSQ